MKLNYFGLILFLGVTFSCRKKELREGVLAENYIPPVEHCYNDYMDGDELGTDCGGACVPCDQLDVPCSLTENEISIADGAIVYTATSWSETSFYSGGDIYYEYCAQISSGKSLTISFFGKPNLSTYYYGGANSVYSTDESHCSIRLVSDSFSNDYLGEYDSRFYVEYLNDKYVFSSCDMLFYPEGVVWPVPTPIEIIFRIVMY